MGCLLVATWGDPFAWREASYRMAGSEGEVRSVTSLSILIEKLSPDAVVVLIPETLLSPSLRSGKEIKKRGGKLLVEELGNLNEENSKWYKDLLDHLERAISEFCGEIGVRAEVALMPNVGEYNGVRWGLGVDVSPDSSYAAFTLLSTFSAASKLLRGIGDGGVKVALDTTHGVNFMPLAAYRAVKAACMILSASNHVKITFEQYNSTPFPIGASGVPELEVFRIKGEVITPVKAAQRLIYSYASRDEVRCVRFSPNFKRVEEFKGKLKGLRDLHSEAGPLAAAVHYSMPLAFLQFSNELASLLRNDPLEPLDPKDLLSEVVVERAGPRVSVVHLISPDYDDLKSSLSAYALVSYGKRVIEGLGSTGELVEAPLSVLKRTLDYLRGPLVKVAEHEIFKFEEARKELGRADDGVRRAVRESEGRWVKVEEGCEDQRRNIVAHAGLSKRLLELKHDGEILLKYHEPCLNQFRDLVSRELRESTGRLTKGEV